jgi:mRNA interferase RelE/StbE
MTGQGLYAVRVKRSAEKEMDRLPQDIFDRVAEAILELEDDPRPHGCKKLKGVEEYRLRVGPYRILYLIDDEKRVVEIVAVGHRREVYRDI